MGVLTASHNETAAHLSDLLEDDLGGIRRSRVERHLRRCEGCRAVLSSLAATIERLRGLAPDLPAHPELADRIVGRLRAGGAK
jgi:predicted anti-sigma-YlaC factor YlaD